jgi:hypothetical protein
LLGFPGDQAVLDIDLPAAGTGTVYAVRGAHDLVMLPTLAITVFPGSIFIGNHAVVSGKILYVLFKET